MTVMTFLSNPRVRALLAHDLLVGLAAFIATLLATPGDHLGRAALVGAATAAVKVVVRTLLPVPPKWLGDFGGTILPPLVVPPVVVPHTMAPTAQVQPGPPPTVTFGSVPAQAVLAPDVLTTEVPPPSI